MSADDDLATSVAEGIISEEQAAAIRARRAGEGVAASAAVPEEPFKLISNFGDIFLCVGILLVYWASRAFLGISGVDPLIVYAGFALGFWLLAELFVFGQKRKLPALLSLIFFVWLGWSAITGFLGIDLPNSYDMYTGAPRAVSHLGIITGLLTLALVRFRQPMLVLGLGVAGTLLAFAIARQYMPEASARLVLLACGLSLLAIGVVLDRMDPMRTKIQHEWALWMFVLGSPLTVHPLMLGMIETDLMREGRSITGAIDAVLRENIALIGVIALGFLLMGLILNRRSLVASVLVYLSAVVLYVSARGGIGTASALALAPLLIGLLVILLGIGWETIRAAMMRALPFLRVFAPESARRRA